MKLNRIETEIDWTRFKVGSSFFIPAYYPEQVVKDLKRELEYMQFDWTYRIQVENSILGVRVWRVA